MKRTIALFLSLLMLVFMFVGCGGNDDKAADGGEKKKVYFVSLKIGGAAWSVAQKGFEDAIEELGWEGHYVAPTTANDASQMANLFETALTNKADGILGTFVSKEIFEDPINRAREAGTFVGNVNVNLDGLEDFFIGTDPVNMGVQQAQLLAELADGKPVKVVYMVMDLSAESIRKSYDAFVEECAKYDNITVHGMESEENNPVVAADKMNNLVKADPDINAVICLDNAGATLGVANFIEENGLQDEFITIGIDASKEILDYVKSGALDVTLDQDFYKMGYEGVMMLKALMEGEEVEYANDSGMIVVRAEDADEYWEKKSAQIK